MRAERLAHELQAERLRVVESAEAIVESVRSALAVASSYAALGGGHL